MLQAMHMPSADRISPQTEICLVAQSPLHLHRYSYCIYTPALPVSWFGIAQVSVIIKLRTSSIRSHGSTNQAVQVWEEVSEVRLEVDLAGSEEARAGPQ